MALWRIPVSWEVYGTVKVEADSLEEAMDIARDDDSIIPLPGDPDYVDGSWRLSETDVEFVRCLYNDNQPDDNAHSTMA